MPYPSEHACRLNDPGKYDKFARKNCDIKSDNKCIDVIYGIKEGKSEIQAYRYPKSSWEAGAARNHCKNHKGSFEAASEEDNSKNVHEKRTYGIDGFTIETREEGKRRIVGHAAIFNRTDGPVWFREQIQAGAFAASVAEDDIRALLNHNPDIVLGRTKAGTLSLREDETGLWMEIDPPDTQAGRDLLVSIGRGDITQASFAFQTLDDEMRTIDGEEVRILKRVKLYDVSPVTYPFYEATNVSLRKQQYLDKLEKIGGMNDKFNTVKLRRKRLHVKHRIGGK